MRNTLAAKCLLIFAAVLAAASTCPAQELPLNGIILDSDKSFWRFRTVWETEEVFLDGQAQHVKFNYPRDFYYRNRDAKEATNYKTLPVETIRLPADTSGDWMKPGFDDSTWIRSHGPMLGTSHNTNWKLILMRGQFEVADPARAGRLTLSASFRGGCVVYLNGEELTRAFMPAGPIDCNTPAEAYPTDAYLDADGYVMFPRDKNGDAPARLAKRVHSLSQFVIPAAKLRKGVNVLAVANHRAPTDACYFLRRSKLSNECNPPHHDTLWAKIGLIGLHLSAEPGAAVLPNVARPAGKGFQVWNLSSVAKVFPSDYPDPFATLQPVRFVAVRGGTFAGQVVVGDDKPITGLRATPGDLVGPGGTIPASAVQVRYGLADGEPDGRKAGAFDSLEELSPAEVAVYRESGGAIQPIWLTVTVPPDARPGNYTGRVAVAADGAAPVAVPVELRVVDWKLPESKDLLARMDIIESPESVAMAYDVPLWSDAHLKLLDKSFSLMAPLAARTLYITCVRRTHFGNEHAMVRWTRNADGGLDPDFSVVENLDVAVKRLGKVPAVILYCWEPTESMGHAGGAGTASRTTDKPILFTLVTDKGDLRPMVGPAWGTPEAKEFWTKLANGIKPVLAKRGLADSMMFGLVGDCRPTKQAMDDIASGAPKTGWAVHSHYYVVNWQGYDMGFAIALWGVGCEPVDPAVGRGYGWKNPFWLNYYPREMSPQSSLVEYRVKLERWMGAKSRSETVYSKAMGTHGLGRLGADFWTVVRNEKGRLTGSLAGRFPESYWGQLNLNYCVPHILGLGKNGPLATVRSEAFRENIQEVEARAFIEAALLDAPRKAALGDDLASRCRTALDERIRMCLHAEGEGLPWFVSSDWAQRTGQLFDLAAEVALKSPATQPGN